MPYEKIVDGDNISYVITGALKIGIETLHARLDLDGSDPQLNYHLCIATLSMAEQTKIKWTNRWFLRAKQNSSNHSLYNLGKIFLDVIDYLATNMSIAELEQMMDRIISDVTEYFPGKDEQDKAVQENHEPVVLNQFATVSSVDPLCPATSDSSDSSDIFSRLSTSWR